MFVWVNQTQDGKLYVDHHHLVIRIAQQAAKGVIPECLYRESIVL